MAYLNNDSYFVNEKFKIKDQAMDNLIINNQEIKLEVADDQIWTTSLQIAEVFEKEHKHILMLNALFSELFFAEKEPKKKKEKRVKK